MICFIFFLLLGVSRSLTFGPFQLYLENACHPSTGQHGHLSSGLHPAHAHMHGGWYTSGMGALSASSGLQGGFSTAGSLGGGVVPHSQSYHLGLGSMVSFGLLSSFHAI